MTKERQKAEDIRKAVRRNYGEVAKVDLPRQGCCPAAGGCCGPNQGDNSLPAATDLGYSEEEINQAPAGSNMGLGCGNPLALASLKTGETVLDLGSGAGFDSFLAARAVGPDGRVIGVDMTPEMIAKAGAAAQREGISNVDFRLGEIERLPVADESIDVILSNCVINLSPEKHKVLSEAYRVLKQGGRLAVSDIVATAPLTLEMKTDLSLISACIGGAEEVETLKEMLETAGFHDIRIDIVKNSDRIVASWFPGKGFEGAVASARIEAIKPPKRNDHSTGNDHSHGKLTKKKVYGSYQSGFHCAEVVAKTILETFSPLDHSHTIKSASGFGGGIAGSLEGLCGAYTGGIIAVGALLGRDKPGDDLRDCAAIINEYTQQFTSRFGSNKCIEAVELMGGQSPMSCLRLTVEASQLLEDLLRQWQRNKGVELRTAGAIPRESVGRGCPFSGGQAAA